MRFLPPILGSLFVTAVNIFIAVPSFASPTQIVIIRHGEKPTTSKDPNLGQQGCIRAYNLSKFFETNATVNQYGKPVAVYAMAPKSKDGAVDPDSTLRPIETIAPTAQAWGMQIQDPATRLDYSTIVNAVNENTGYEGKTVVIAWEHNSIPGLAQAFGATLSADQQKWPGDVYDEAWILEFTNGGVSLNIIPEDALPIDNPNGGAQWTNGPTGVLSPDYVNSYPQCADDNALDTIVNQLAVPSV